MSSRHFLSHMSNNDEYSKSFQTGWVVKRLNYRSNYVVVKIRKD